MTEYSTSSCSTHKVVLILKKRVTACVFYFVCFQSFSQTSHPSEHSCEYSSCKNLNVFKLIKPFHSLVSKKNIF